MKKPDAAFSVATAEDSPGFLLWQVTTLWQRGIRRALETIDITHPQFVILASLLWLSGQKTSVTQIDLSQHSQIDPMTLSAILKILNKKGLVERREHETDTRAKVVILTAVGLKTTRKAVKIIETFDTDFFKSLGDKAPAFTAGLRLLLIH